MEETRTRRGWHRLGYIPLKKYFSITATEYRRSQMRKMTARDIVVEPLKKRIEKEKLKVVNRAIKMINKTEQRWKKRLNEAVRERTDAIFETMYKSLYRVDVNLIDEEGNETGQQLSLTYYGDDYFCVGDKVQIYVRGDLCRGTITTKGADTELYDGFPAGLREIQSRIDN